MRGLRQGVRETRQAVPGSLREAVKREPCPGTADGMLDAFGPFWGLYEARQHSLQAVEEEASGLRAELETMRASRG